MAELPDIDFAVIERVTAAAFGQRRKTLRNALTALLDETGIRAAGVDPGARAEELPVTSFIALAKQTLTTTAVNGRASRHGA
jgi:16S rRNA (adenine1518-N6/adenine1519-N6)-dimethyltransferase